MQVQRTPEEIAWAAGLFEGEGWWGFRGKTSAEAVIGTTDRDVAERFGDIVGLGSLTVERRTENGHKTLYRWSVSSAPGVKALIELFWPWLGERRQASAEAILERIAVCRGPNAQKTHCPHGHAYDEANTYLAPSGDRRCRACHRDRVNEANRQKRRALAMRST